MSTKSKDGLLLITECRLKSFKQVMHCSDPLVCRCTPLIDFGMRPVGGKHLQSFSQPIPVVQSNKKSVYYLPGIYLFNISYTHSNLKPLQCYISKGGKRIITTVWCESNFLSVKVSSCNYSLAQSVQCVMQEQQDSTIPIKVMMNFQLQNNLLIGHILII